MELGNVTEPVTKARDEKRGTRDVKVKGIDRAQGASAVTEKFDFAGSFNTPLF